MDDGLYVVRMNRDGCVVYLSHGSQWNENILLSCAFNKKLADYWQSHVNEPAEVHRLTESELCMLVTTLQLTNQMLKHEIEVERAMTKVTAAIHGTEDVILSMENHFTQTEGNKA